MQSECTLNSTLMISYVPGEGLSSAICLANVPLKLKKIFIVRTVQLMGDTCLVCVSGKAAQRSVVSVCPASPCFITLQGEEL